jgi:hypothetical protein
MDNTKGAYSHNTDNSDEALLRYYVDRLSQGDRIFLITQLKISTRPGCSTIARDYSMF